MVLYSTLRTHSGRVGRQAAAQVRIRETLQTLPGRDRTTPPTRKATRRTGGGVSPSRIRLSQEGGSSGQEAHNHHQHQCSR
ncbi:unnamed protein product [Vitrella brassicaformis CCMP3155]|uniref:Uncharacterized protein n=1 Tax=Vitrella brassicaformis (strain CCMP3155) TaxID=1169540 RepID=A0A0G4EWE8_VITBC|nr:unnamed protein product [Vitrella brassicaformis CCMP3155]|eukprot:CEM02820.1 unnamed protein product [Vitrella brassicaformis CCMP3155]